MVHGDVLSLVERLDDEYTKILQATDAHSTDFVTKSVRREGESWVGQTIATKAAGLLAKTQTSPCICSNWCLLEVSSYMPLHFLDHLRGRNEQDGGG